MREKRVAKVNKKRCVACGACMVECKKGAISIHKGCYADVNEQKCVGCGICAKTCPAGCIQILKQEVEA